ncbi:MAG TPA: GNAT family N-acetyltransferase [Acidocella sp.]|nr:GNAT family N-acetyltransferase [Acidocella sp.]
MLDYTRRRPDEAFDRVVVRVTFLRMNRRPARPPAVLPPGMTLQAERLETHTYRRLYDAVGTPWLWWLRRMMPEELLRQHLENPAVQIYVLRKDGAAVGFFETDATHWPDVNLNYFGLVPEEIGHGLGKLLLDVAVDTVFRAPGLRGMTLNTCTADHPRALPNYLAAGFQEVRQVREVWDIPCRLGFQIPEHLRT